MSTTITAPAGPAILDTVEIERFGPTDGAAIAAVRWDAHDGFTYRAQRTSPDRFGIVRTTANGPTILGTIDAVDLWDAVANSTEIAR